MKLLLDTHVWLWALNNPSRLSHHVRDVLKNPTNEQLPLPQRDPADRFLVATAQVMDLTLVTADDTLLQLGTIRTMKN